MTKRLILIRHAKSSWDDPFMTDHDRPLNARGRASADALGAWLAREGIAPDAALVSSAQRTRETWERMAKKAPFDVKPDISPALYLGEPDVMLTILKNQSAQRVALIAHNPGISYMAQSLFATPPADSRFSRFPTGTTVVIDFDVETWSDVTWRSGTLHAIAYPRELMAEELA